MAFSWGGQGEPDQGESPASSGSGGHVDQGRGFWLGGGASDRSEDESDGGYGLFNNDYAGFSSAGAGEGLSKDFWSIDDMKPMNEQARTGMNIAPGSSSVIGGDTFSNTQTGSYEDPLMKARKELLLGSSPDAMETFDDLAGFGSASNQPNPAGNTFNTSNTASNVFGLYSGAQNESSTPQGLDPNSLFGSIPSSVFASPSSTSSASGGINLQELLGGTSQSSSSAFPAYGQQGMIGQQSQLAGQVPQQHQQQQQQQPLSSNTSGTNTLLSPQSFFQQLSFSSGTSDPTNSSSSRDSSSDPPGTARRESVSASDAGNYTQPISPHSNDQNTSSASTTRISTAANSPPVQNVGLRHIKSGSSLASQGDRSMQMTSSHSYSGTNMLAMPDKVSQQQAAETTSVVKHVTRDSQIRGKDGSSLCQLLVLGLPDEGARSRVETQVKVGLILLRPKPKATGQTALNYKDAKGALLQSANDNFDKVGLWKYLALPAVSSVKRRARKHFKASVPPEETLFADIKVVSASVPSREIAICQNCQQREVKRQQRKTQNRSKPSGDIDSGREDEEGLSDDELAKRKIVLFNCGQYLEFNNGETVIPTRITCYCRHHKEKYGFTITYTLTDHLGQVVATAMSPPIFLTDDHKAKPTKPDNIDLNHITSLARVANGPNGNASQKSSAWNSAASSMPSSAASSQASSAASSAVPSRSNSVENLDELHQNSSHTSRSRKERSSKPYNLDSRPNKPKKPNNLNRLNSFTMTPLNLSAPGSPRLAGPSPLTTTSQLPPDYNLAGSAAPLQSFSDMMQASTTEANNLNARANDHQSPGSSLSAPSTPGAGSLESFSTSLPSQAGFQFTGPSSMTSTSDEFASAGSRSVEQSPLYSNMAPLPQLQQSNLNQHLASLNMVNPATAQAQQPRPRISRIIPNEGPTHGGTEVIILGENFTSGLEITFGETPAVAAQAWGGNTLVCILPPSPSPGPVVVAFKNIPIAVNDNSGLQFFTYVDTSDKALMELALQVVGMKMSGGRIEDARNVARRIIGAGGGPNSPFSQGGLPTQQANNASSQASASGAGQFFAINGGGETRDFQAMILKVLAMLDVDYSDAAPDMPANPVDHINDQKHTLLHLAAVLGFHRLVSWLIERDASLDMQDKHGYTPLHLAALCGRVTITRLLLQAGATHDLTNQAGQSPVDIARERDQIDVEALFTRHTPSRSASCMSLPHVQEEEESWSPPTNGPRSPRSHHLFTLGSGSSSQYDSDSDSDWSADDDEAHFASESELESHITRLSRKASAASLRMERSLNTSHSSKSSRDSKKSSSQGNSVRAASRGSEDPEPTSKLPPLSWASHISASRLGRRFSQLKLPTPPSLHSWRGIASAAMSSSPSAASFSLSSQDSAPVTAPDSETEPTNWPASLLHGLHLPASKVDGSGVRASLGRKLGYSIDHITEDALRSYSYHAQKYGGTLRKDKMLYFFWLPLFLIAMIWVYCQASAFVTSTLGIFKESVIARVPDLRIV